MKAAKLATSKFGYALALAAIFSIAGAAQAATYNTGFESSEGYTVGPANGENSWFTAPNEDIENQVFAGRGQTGQALHIGMPAVTTGVVNFQFANAPVAYTISKSDLVVSVDFLRRDTTIGVQTAINVIGTVLHSDGTTGEETLAQIGTVCTNYAPYVCTSGSTNLFLGNFNSSTSPVSLTTNVWHKLTLTFNFKTKTVSVAVDGNSSLGPIAIGAVDQNGQAVNTAQTVNRVQLYSITSSSATPADSFFDNLAVTYNTGATVH